MGHTPTFPVLLQCIPQPEWQRSLIPIESPNFEDEPGDPPGWVASGGYRMIDRDGRTFSATFDGQNYEFAATGSVTDEELRELMSQNLRSLRRSSHEYLECARSLHGQDLFDYTFRTAQAVPAMSATMHAGGCVLIAILCVLAAAIPAGLIWWFLR